MARAAVEAKPCTTDAANPPTQPVVAGKGDSPVKRLSAISAPRRAHSRAVFGQGKLSAARGELRLSSENVTSHIRVPFHSSSSPLLLLLLPFKPRAARASASITFRGSTKHASSVGCPRKEHAGSPRERMGMCVDAQRQSMTSLLVVHAVTTRARPLLASRTTTPMRPLSLGPASSGSSSSSHSRTIKPIEAMPQGEPSLMPRCSESSAARLSARSALTPAIASAATSAPAEHPTYLTLRRCRRLQRSIKRCAKPCCQNYRENRLSAPTNKRRRRPCKAASNR